MKPVVLDTDTLSYFFRNNASVVDKIAIHLEEFGHINISVITYYEILNGLHFKDAKK